MNYRDNGYLVQAYGIITEAVKGRPSTGKLHFILFNSISGSIYTGEFIIKDKNLPDEPVPGRVIAINGIKHNGKFKPSLLPWVKLKSYVLQSEWQTLDKCFDSFKYFTHYAVRNKNVQTSVNTVTKRYIDNVLRPHGNMGIISYGEDDILIGAFENVELKQAREELAQAVGDEDLLGIKDLFDNL